MRNQVCACCQRSTIVELGSEHGFAEQEPRRMRGLHASKYGCMCDECCMLHVARPGMARWLALVGSGAVLQRMFRTGGMAWYKKAKPGESAVQPCAVHGEARSCNPSISCAME